MSIGVGEVGDRAVRLTDVGSVVGEVGCAGGAADTALCVSTVWTYLHAGVLGCARKPEVVCRASGYAFPRGIISKVRPGAASFTLL
jgi:hypothetical protein